MFNSTRRTIIAIVTALTDTFFSLQVCTSTKPMFQYLSVSTVQPGVGHIW